MIDVKSVRVGNILAYCTHPCTIHSIGNNTFGFTHPNNPNDFLREVNNNNFKPIPLTPQILEKCGLKGMHTKRLYKVFKISPAQSGGYNVHISNELGTMDIQQCGIPTLNYLHQLQNLYYALTGEELNIQL
jgi:hypothetical protein